MKCELCGSNRRDSIKYGEFLTKNGKGVHTNCLYLSSAIAQNGKDEEGILGFLPNDIAAERKRVSTIRCCYCGEMMANIGCCEKRCRLKFHMICGIENGAMNQFLDTFRSFCHRHIRKVNYRPKTEDECYICYEKIFNESTRFNAVNMIRAPCCRNGWFHKYCLQQFAKNAGYFFKCPLCNDINKFKRNMSLWGIFVQNKDAEWELVPNAYAELLERPNVCAAETCRNTKGRVQQHNSNPFLYCVTCGSVAMHRHCTPLRSHSFECDNCKSILHADSGRESMSSQQQYVGETVNHDAVIREVEDSNVDVCGSASDEEDDCDVIQGPNIEKGNSLQMTQLVDGLNDFYDNAIDCKIQYGAVCSYDEGFMDAVREQQNVTNMQECTIEHKVPNINTLTAEAPNSGEGRQCSEISDALNVSCIAQRTRRKSVMTCLPAIEEEESAEDDNKTTNIFKSSKCYEIFEYDDGDDDDEATDNMKNDVVCSIEPKHQKTANSLDISCIANRTRRRFMNKMEAKAEVKNICEEPDTDDHSTMSSHSSYQPHQHSDLFEYVGCEDTDTESVQHNNDYSNNLLNYFYQLLHDVKLNSQPKYQQTENSNDENVDEKEVKADPLNTSCIANRTRRRFGFINVVDTINEMDTDTEDSKPAADSSSATSSHESYKSYTFFGNTVEHKNGANIKTKSHEIDNASKRNRSQSVSSFSRKRSYDEITKRRVCDLTARVPTKIAAIIKPESNNDDTNCADTQTVSSKRCEFVRAEMKLEGQENILEQSCIANRTRRKSLEFNHLKKFVNIDRRKERYASVDEQALTNCKNRALTRNNVLPKAPHYNKALTTSPIRRDQSSRLPPRRLIECNDAYNNNKSILEHSPVGKYANWSNIKDNSAAYTTPNYVYVNGKLKSALKESAQKASHITAAQTQFSRSYQLLLACNENRYASTSANTQRV